MTAPDHDCIKLCTNGHSEAYAQLVRRYQAPLSSYLAGRLGDAERVAEAAQETFVRAFFALDKLEAPEAFFPWLLGIASRVAKEQKRDERRHREAVRSYPGKTTAPAQVNDRALAEALAKLPEPYAQVILLRYYGGLPCARVAQRLGVPVGTVTKRLSRAYAMLRETLCEPDRRTKNPEVYP